MYAAWAGCLRVAPLLALRGWGHCGGRALLGDRPALRPWEGASRYPGAVPSASRCWRHSHSSCACSSPDLMFGTGGEEHITSARRSAAHQGRCAANPKLLFSAFFAEALAACQIPRLFDIHSATLIAFQVEEIRAFPGLSFSLLPGCSGWLRAERRGPAQKGPAAIQLPAAGLASPQGPACPHGSRPSARGLLSVPGVTGTRDVCTQGRSAPAELLMCRPLVPALGVEHAVQLLAPCPAPSPFYLRVGKCCKTCCFFQY